MCLCVGHVQVHCIEGVYARQLCRVSYTRLPPCRLCCSVFQHAFHPFYPSEPALWCHRTGPACSRFVRGIWGSLAGAECFLEHIYISVTSIAVTALLSRTNMERRYCANASAATLRTHTGLLCHQAADKLASHTDCSKKEAVQLAMQQLCLHHLSGNGAPQKPHNNLGGLHDADSSSLLRTKTSDQLLHLHAPLAQLTDT